MEIYRKVGSGISFIKGKPALNIYARDAYNNRHTLVIPDLPCYFYVKENEVFEEEDMKSVIGMYNGYYSLYGEPLKKVVVKKISEIKRLGRLYGGFESDLKWDKKALLDLQITARIILIM